MRGARSLAAILLLAGGFAWGMLRLFGTQFAAGDFYPEYSSLRSDPKGAKLLFDSLARVPGISVTRNYLPLEYAPGKAAVLLLGLDPNSLDSDFLKRAEQLARRGNRVIVALNLRGDYEPQNHNPLADEWHVRLVVDPDTEHLHRLSFRAGPEWVVRRQGGNARGIERNFGPSSVLLLAESGDFSNESTIAGDRLDRITAAIGSPTTRVVFDESHFGIAESGSVVQLVRRFRLTGLALGLVIVGALAIWRNTAAFPPPAETPDRAQHLGRTSFDGLVALLRRHVRSKDLVQTCWAEWSKANRRLLASDRASRASAIAAGAAQRPLEAMRKIQSELPARRAEGEL